MTESLSNALVCSAAHIQITPPAPSSTTATQGGEQLNSTSEPVERPKNILEAYSLRGQAVELEATMQTQHPFLGTIALTGQATTWYAAPNTGKTLLAIYLITEAVAAGHIDPSNIFYIAADDSAAGLVDKLHILDEINVHVVAPGHNHFDSSKLTTIIAKMTETDSANGICIIVDTLKKFVSLMDKSEARKFGTTIREFVMKGGTFLGLAHTNKNRSTSGSLVYAGTTDNLEDVDCAYMIDRVDGSEGNRRTIAFENIKRRGNVAEKVAYSYSTLSDQTFDALLASVELVGDADLSEIYRKAEVRSDSVVIEAIVQAVREGLNSKMVMARTVGSRLQVGRGRVVDVIERYTGTDPSFHRWHFSVGGHGKRVYVLHEAEQLAA